MKSIKALLVVTALSISSLAMAEGGADRTFAEQARQTSLEAYRVAQQQKVEAPVASSPTEQAEHTNC